MEIYLVLQEKKEDGDRRSVGCDGEEGMLREGGGREVGAQSIRMNGENFYCI